MSNFAQVCLNGYHIVTGIVPRTKKVDGTDSSLLEFRAILDSKFNPVKSKQVRECDAEYCKVVTREQIEALKKEQIQHIADGCDHLLSFLP